MLMVPSLLLFLSTLSLRRATNGHPDTHQRGAISIHALLAESDGTILKLQCILGDFYPRSPCGERPIDGGIVARRLQFLSTLSLRRATAGQRDRMGRAGHFYPRSPCGERHQVPQLYPVLLRISIHALLAESDKRPRIFSTICTNFYPRSPCGERPNRRELLLRYQVFLSTLSLRRATTGLATIQAPRPEFLSTLSLRRATPRPPVPHLPMAFLSTLSLRRATRLRGGHQPPV